MNKPTLPGQRKEPKKPKPDTIPIEKVYDLWTHIPNPRYKLAYAVLYLTAARVTEALHLRREDITVEKLGNQTVYIFSLINLKNKIHKTKNIPIVPRTIEEKQLIAYILEYSSTMPYATPLLAPATRHTIKNYFRENIRFTVRTVGKKTQYTKLKLYPHYLRHCRLDYLKDLPTFELVAIAGWRSTEPAEHYIRRDWKRIARALLTNQ